MLALALSCDFEILFLKRPCLILCLLDSGVTLGGLGLDWPIEYCCVEEVPVPMVRMCVCVFVYHGTDVEIKENFLSSSHVRPKDWITLRAIRFVSKHPHSLSHLAGSYLVFKMISFPVLDLTK